MDFVSYHPTTIGIVQHLLFHFLFQANTSRSLIDFLTLLKADTHKVGKFMIVYPRNMPMYPPTFPTRLFISYALTCLISRNVVWTNFESIMK